MTPCDGFTNHSLNGASGKYGILEKGAGEASKERDEMARQLRELSEEERKTLERLVHARTTPVGKLKRAQIIWLASQDQHTPEIAGAGRSASLWSACHLSARAGERDHSDSTQPTAGFRRRGLRDLDAGSAGGLLASGQRHSHAA